LQELQVETIDRFGLLPDAAKNLFEIAELKLIASQRDVQSIDVGPAGGVIKFVPNPDINIEKLMRAIATNPSEYRFAGTESLQVSRDMPEPEHRFDMINYVLELIRND